MFFNRKKQHTQHPTATADTKAQGIGANLNFVASEAYKLLRTNLMFSFTDDGSSARVIGVTSTFRGEGKSLTSINLAYSLAQAGHKVLLLECDLRLPSISKTLNISLSPGVVDCLVGERRPFQQVTQKYPGDGTKFDIMTAGATPPNPSELLGASRMTTLMEELSQHYQYIVVDLPPVSMVSDPLVMSPNLYGYVIVVRHDYCERSALRDTMRPLEYANAKILGFVYNGSAEGGGRYYRGSYKKYSKKYSKYYQHYKAPEEKK